MEYEKLKDMYTYSGQSTLRFPKGNPPGTGTTLYLLTPNHLCAPAILNSKFVQLNESMFKIYFIDTRYRRKIGYQTINENMTGELAKTFDSLKTPIQRVVPTAMDGKFKANKNIIIDLGHWMELWFAHSLRRNMHEMCTEFITFLKENISEYESHSVNIRKKIIYVPLDRWPIDDLTVQLDKLVNPLSILLCAIYKYPVLINDLNGLDFIFVDSEHKQFMKVASTSLTKENYPALKNQLKKFEIFKGYKMEDEEDTSDGHQHTHEVNKNKAALIQAVTQKINAELVKDDAPVNITSPEDDKELGDGILSAEELKKIEDIANDVISDSDGSETEEELIDEIESASKNNIFVTKFTPDRSKSQLKKIEELTAKQFEVITKQSADVLESKIIDSVRLDGVTDTLNPSLYQSNYKDLDQSYVKKKLKADINGAVTKLSQTDYPVFVTNITEEDTSDPKNLKKTLTYDLEDINGKKMKLKFDVPIVIDGCYIYIGGGKKIIGHQHILKPVVKSGPDEVQLVTFHNKAFMYRKGNTDMLTGKLKKFISTNEDKFKVHFGNTYLKNKSLPSTLEIDTFAKTMTKFTVGDAVFEFDFAKNKEHFKSLGISLKGYDENKHILVGYEKRSKQAIFIEPQENFTELVMSYMSEDDIKGLSKVKGRTSLMYTDIKLLGNYYPLIYIMCYCEGFTSAMEKAKIDYAVVSKDEMKKYDPNQWGSIKCSDGYIMWKRYPLRNTLLMNGFAKMDVSEYTVADLDNKETYIDMVTLFAQYANTAFNLDQWKNFILDDVTKEVLADFNQPTDLVELLAYCNSLLTANPYLDINNEENVRIRSTEVIAELVYGEVSAAYNAYRKSMHKKDKATISIKPDAVIKKLTMLETVDEASDLNPILESEKKHSITYKGSHGINMERAMSLKRRMYDDSMIGVCGIITSNDGKVGISHQLTVNPTVTSTRGYIQVTPKDEIDKLSTDQLCTCSELLTPLAVSHDDPPRTSMTFKQSQYTLPIADSSPVMIGNKFESFLPYHTSDVFSKVAKQDGKVIDYDSGVYIIQYKDGTYDSFDTNEVATRNASQGFYLTAKMTTDLKVGDKVKANQVVAWNDKIYSKNNDLTASMNIGSLCKVAILPQQNQYEDSTPITSSLSERLATDIVVEKETFLPATATIRSIVQIGDTITTGDRLITFDSSTGNKDIDEFLMSFEPELRERIEEHTADDVKSKYSGVISDIQIDCTTDVENLSESLQSIVKTYHKKIDKKHRIYRKYSNEGDNNYYRCGTLLKESTEVIKTNAEGKIKGEKAENGVIIRFYIKHTDRVKKGDKVAIYSALKGVVSEVLDPGQEQYSSFRPNEEISTSLAPGAILARKVGSIMLVLFGNKVLIECKRKMKSIYFDQDFKDTY